MTAPAPELARFDFAEDVDPGLVPSLDVAADPAALRAWLRAHDAQLANAPAAHAVAALLELGELRGAGMALARPRFGGIEAHLLVAALRARSPGALAAVRAAYEAADLRLAAGSGRRHLDPVAPRPEHLLAAGYLREGGAARGEDPAAAEACAAAALDGARFGSTALRCMLAWRDPAAVREWLEAAAGGADPAEVLEPLFLHSPDLAVEFARKARRYSPAQGCNVMATCDRCGGGACGDCGHCAACDRRNGGNGFARRHRVEVCNDRDAFRRAIDRRVAWARAVARGGRPLGPAVEWTYLAAQVSGGALRSDALQGFARQLDARAGQSSTTPGGFTCRLLAPHPPDVRAGSGASEAECAAARDWAAAQAAGAGRLTKPARRRPARR